jgi:hypothetical protein
MTLRSTPVEMSRFHYPTHTKFASVLQSGRRIWGDPEHRMVVGYLPWPTGLSGRGPSAYRTECRIGHYGCVTDTTGVPDPRPVNRALVDIMRSGKGGNKSLDDLMEEAGGEAAAQWRRAGMIGRAWDTYREAEQSYWNTVPQRQLILETVATLRMAESILLATELTLEHQQHGWNPRIIEVLASMCAEFRGQVEAGTFENPRAGEALGRIKMEEVSPKWPDLDELSVALGHAERMLDILGQRMNLDPNMA